MSYLESEALCPYYITDKSGVIQCEIGAIRCKDNLMHRFIGYGYCADKFERCPFKIALDKYYERAPEEAVKEKCEPLYEQIMFF